MEGVAEITAERVQPLLRTARYGRSLRVLTQTDSTNDDAHGDAAQGAIDGHVVVADAQRSGRGSHGRTWASPAGTDLYLSIVARPELALNELPPLTLAVGLGVAEAVEQLLGAGTAQRTEVKWPNDVWLAGKKCAGVLLESRSAAPQVVIGVGLNVNRLQFPAELVPLATSLRAHRRAQEPLDRARVLAVLLGAIERWVDRFVAERGKPVAEALARRLALRGQRVRCGSHEGYLVGVADSGALRLSTEAGLVEVIAGRIEPLAPS